MQSLTVDGYTEDQVKAALHGSPREIRFKYELLDKENQHRLWLDGVESASISHNSLASIKRGANFKIQDRGVVDWLNDRIRPWFRLQVLGGWAEWPLGIFLLSTPTRAISSLQDQKRDVTAYDQAVILKDDKVEDRHTETSGTNVIDAVRTLLTGSGITLHALVSTTEVLPADRDWKPGTEKLQIINDLLSSINYRTLHFNSAGAAVAEPYQSPDNRPIGYTYAADSKSLISPNATHELDLFAVANKWVLVVSEPERAPLIAQYTNQNPDSPTSTVNRGRTIVDFREEQEATSQAALDAQVQRIAFEASQIYEAVEFETALMPHHEDAELIQLDYAKIGAKARYVEHTWSMELKAGAMMKHRVRRVVSV